MGMSRVGGRVLRGALMLIWERVSSVGVWGPAGLVVGCVRTRGRGLAAAREAAEVENWDAWWYVKVRGRNGVDAWLYNLRDTQLGIWLRARGVIA